VHGLTWPLITRADGQKFGKSVDGAVWLDPERTLPYEFHQYWLRTDDRDVERFLLQLTLLDVGTVSELVAAHAAAPERRLAQRRLADEVTALVHGPDAVRRANLAAGALFGSGDLDAEELEALRGVIPETIVDAGALAADGAVPEVLVATGLAASKSEARRLLDQQGVSVNRQRIGETDDLVALVVGGRYLLVQRGKKQRHLVVVDGDAPAGP
jgi:tyrosyl-tRNA synthetase